MWLAGYVKEHLLNVLFTVVPRQFFDHSFAFFDVWSGPDEQSRQIDADHVRKSPVFLTCNKLIPTIMTRTNCQGRNYVVVVVHNPLVVREVVKDPEHLWDCFEPTSLC